MKISLTTATENRRFNKALVRTYSFTQRLNRIDIGHTHADWDILQIVLGDQLPLHFESHGISRGKFGRLLQVSTGAPIGLTLLPADDDKFIDGCAAQVSFAISNISMTDELRALMINQVDQARVDARTEMIGQSKPAAIAQSEKRESSNDKD